MIQGSVDTLFPLEDGFANYANIGLGGAPVKLMTYCGPYAVELTAVPTLPLTFPVSASPCRGNNGGGLGKGPCGKR